MTCPKCRREADLVEIGRWMCFYCWLSWFTAPHATEWAFYGTRQAARLWRVEIERREQWASGDR